MRRCFYETTAESNSGLAVSKTVTMAALSILLSAVSYFTFWMGLPVLIFPPLAFYFGWRAYRDAEVGSAKPAGARRAFQAVPMIVAVLCFVYEFHLLNSGKWA